jgi:hypothetical protein
MKAIMLLMAAISMGIWALVGLAIWVPLLVRAAVLLLAASIYAATTHASIASAVAGLKHSVVFYFRGFKWIAESITQDVPETGDVQALDWSKFGHFLFTIVASVAFWVLTVLTIRALPAAAGWLAELRERVLPRPPMVDGLLAQPGILSESSDAATCRVENNKTVVMIQSIKPGYSCSMEKMGVVGLKELNVRIKLAHEQQGLCGVSLEGKGGPRGATFVVAFMVSERGTALLAKFVDGRWQIVRGEGTAVPGSTAVPGIRTGLHVENEVQIVILRDTVSALANGTAYAWQGMALPDSGLVSIRCDPAAAAAFRWIRIDRISRRAKQPFGRSTP